MREELFETILTPPHSLPSFFPRGGTSSSFGSYQDPAVPFPRYSGARFCGVGKNIVLNLFTQLFSKPNRPKLTFLRSKLEFISK